MFKSFIALRRSCTTRLFLLIIVLVLAHTAHIKAQRMTIASSVIFAAQPAPNADALSVKDRVEAFEQVWKNINEKYYDPLFNGVDWKALHERYRPRVDSAKSDEEFYALLSQMVRELHDSHTRFSSPRERQNRKRRQGTSAGVSIGEVEGSSAIVAVRPDSDAARAGVKPGMLVRTIDGRPIDERISEARREIGNISSERATRLYVYARIVAGEPDAPLTLGLARADGAPLEVTLMRRTIQASRQIVSRLLPSGYAYIKFNQFDSPLVEQIKEALQTFKNAPGLILDLRSNGGGDLEEAVRLAGYFFNSRILVGRAITRSGKPLSLFGGLVRVPMEAYAGRPGNQIYGSPVVVLIAEPTASAAETFTAALQENNRAYIIGRQSCGCALATLGAKEVKGGGELKISEIGGTTGKGRKLEGAGVTPDKLVPLKLIDLQSGRDAGIEEAENYLKQLSGKQTSSAHE